MKSIAATFALACSLSLSQAGDARPLSIPALAPDVASNGPIHSPTLSGNGGTLWFIADPGALDSGPGLYRLDTTSLTIQLALAGRIVSYSVAASGAAVAVELDEDHPELGDSNGVPDVYHLAIPSGGLSLASRKTSSPSAGHLGARNPQISRRGDLILFESSSEDLVSQDKNRAPDVFLYAKESDSVALVSFTGNNTNATASFGASDPFFALGDEAAGYATRTLIFGGSTSEILLRRLAGARALSVVSAGLDNVKVPACCEGVAVSPNGQFVTFRAGSPNRRLLIKDLATGILVELPGPHHAVNGILPFEISNDGMRIITVRPNSSPGAPGLEFGLFDRLADRASLVATNRGGAAAFVPRWASLSVDGRHLFFTAGVDQICCGGAANVPLDLFHRDLREPEMSVEQFMERGLVSRPWPGLPHVGGVGVVSIAELPEPAATFMAAWESSAPTTGGIAPTDIFWTPVPATAPPRSLRALLKTPASTTSLGDSLLGAPPLDDAGKWMVFESKARLTSHPASPFRQIYLRGLDDSAPILVSAGRDGAPANAHSFAPSISPSGNAVAFFSWASNLADADMSTDSADLFLHDRLTGEVELVNAGLPNSPPPFQGVRPSSVALSADASKMVFLANIDTNRLPVLFLRDRTLGVTRMVAYDTLETSPAYVDPVPLQISRDGKWVVFYTSSKSAPPLNYSGIRLYNTETREFLTTADPFGGPFGLSPGKPAFDRASSKISMMNRFPSSGLNEIFVYDILQNSSSILRTDWVTTGITGDGRHVFGTVRPMTSGLQIEWISLGDQRRTSIDFESPDSTSWLPRSTPTSSVNGDWIAFEFNANHTPSGDTNNALDIFLAHRPTGSLRRLDFLEGLSPSHPVLAPDGSFLLFHAMADSGGDRNGSIDIYRLDLDTAPADSDGDGLPDPWETTYFDNLGAGPDEDPDGDGMTNLQEYRAGTNPRDGASILALQALRSVTTGTVHLVWAAAPGVRYQVEWRHALDGSAWEPLGPAATHEAGAATAVDTSASAPSRFYRLRVVP